MGPNTKKNFVDERGGGTAFGDAEVPPFATVAPGWLVPGRVQSFLLIGWQGERAELLQQICERLEAARAQGQTVRVIARRQAQRYHGRVFRCAPDRTLRLSAATLLGLYFHWRKAGRSPAAFHLHYRGGAPVIYAPVLCRFVEFCAANRLASYRLAWKQFAARNGSFGRGRRATRKRRLPIPFKCLRAYFSRADFAALQRGLAQIAEANRALAALRLKHIAKIRSQLAERPANLFGAKHQTNP